LLDLDEILYLLSDDVIFEKIDAPIDEILRKYSYSISDEITKKEFILIISGFLEQLKEQGVLVSINSNEFSEVFWFLEKYYNVESDNGYVIALYDALKYGSTGIEMILEETSNSLKREHENNYLKWIYDTKIIYLSWESKIKLIEELTNKYGDDLSPEVRNLPNEQLAPFIPELLVKVTNATQVIKSRLETKLFN